MSASSASVAELCAVLTFRAIQSDYSTVFKEMHKIYNARSKYVHEGRTPEAAAYEQVERIAREVAFCLFRLQRDKGNRKAGFQTRWLNDIDYVAAAIDA